MISLFQGARGVICIFAVFIDRNIAEINIKYLDPAYRGKIINQGKILRNGNEAFTKKNVADFVGQGFGEDLELPIDVECITGNLFRVKKREI